jgi:hypothetical protein
VILLQALSGRQRIPGPLLNAHGGVRFNSTGEFRVRSRYHYAGARLVLCLSMPAAAEVPLERSWHATLYLGQWLSSNLPDVPRWLGTGAIEWSRPISRRCSSPDGRYSGR